MTAANEQQTSNAEIIDLGEIFRILLGNWKIIIACVFFAIFLAIIYLREASLVYSVDGLIQIESDQNDSSLFNALNSAVNLATGGSDKSPAETEMQLLRSRFVLGRAVRNLNLDVVLTSDRDKWYKRLFHSNTEQVINSAEGVHYSADGMSFDVRKFDVPFSLLGQTFQLTFLDNNRYMIDLIDRSKISGFENQAPITGVVGRLLTQPVGDGVLQLLIQKNDNKQGSVYLMKKSLLRSVGDINDGLQITEKGKQSGVLSLVYEGNRERTVQTLNEIMRVYLQQNIDSQTEETQNTLEFLEHQLPQSKAELEAAEDRYNKFREKNNTIDPTEEAQLLLKQSVDLKTRKIDLEQQSALLGQKYTNNFPMVAQAKAQVDAINQELQSLDAKVTAMPELQRQYLQVYRDVQVNTALYTSLLNSYQQLKVLKAGKVATVRILDQAIQSPAPVKPQKAFILLLSAIVGVTVGSILVLFKNFLFSGIKDSSYIEARTGLSVLATVPRSLSQRRLYVRHAKRRGLLANIDPEDLAVESLKSLRTVVHFAEAKTWNNIILITGPAPEIGKSFISANFATVLAQMGKSVVLVDADMRRGTLKSYFNLEKAYGLSDYLKNSSLELGDVCVNTMVAGLDFVERGSASVNPAELLLTGRFKTLLDGLSLKYDYVLIDTPPVLAATDAAIMATMAGMTLMVARYGHTHIRELELSVSRLSQAGASVHGIVFNDVQVTGGGYGYHYAYQYRSHK